MFWQDKIVLSGQQFIYNLVHYIYTIHMARYSTISVPQELHDELQNMVKKKPELGYSSIAEFCKEAIRVHVSNIRAERREAFIQQLNLPNLFRNIELLSQTKGGEYRQIFENLMGCAFFISPDGKIVNCNNEIADHLGYAGKGELMEKDISVLFADINKMDEMMMYVAENGFVRNYEIKLIRKDGKPLDFLLSIGTVKENGEIKGYVGTGEDITFRKMVEARLKRERDMYSYIINEMYDAIIVFQDGKIKFAGGQCKSLGYGPEEIVGMKVLDLIASEDRKRAIETTRKRMSGEDVPAIQRYKIISKDGEVREVETSTKIIEYEGRPASLSVVRIAAKPC